MPKVAVNYSNTIIYKIVCKDLNVKELYVGHTINFRMRKHAHKNACVSEKDKNHNLKVYKFIRDHGGWDNWEMVEIEKYDCCDGNEARAREREWYEQLEANLNNNYPNRKIPECKKAYKQRNPEKIKMLKNKKNDCECGGKYLNKHQGNHKQTIKHKTYLLNQELEKNKQEE